MTKRQALTELAERPTSFMLNGVRHTYVKEITGPPAEIRHVHESEADASRISSLLTLKQEAEQEIAKILRKRLDADGEPKWLAWCEAQWGWSRPAAYKHLNPELLDKDRQAARARLAYAMSARRITTYDFGAALFLSARNHPVLFVELDPRGKTIWHFSEDVREDLDLCLRVKDHLNAMRDRAAAGKDAAR